MQTSHLSSQDQQSSLVIMDLLLMDITLLKLVTLLVWSANLILLCMVNLLLLAQDV